MPLPASLTAPPSRKQPRKFMQEDWAKRFSKSDPPHKSDMRLCPSSMKRACSRERKTRRFNISSFCEIWICKWPVWQRPEFWDYLRLRLRLRRLLLLLHRRISTGEYLCKASHSPRLISPVIRYILRFFLFPVELLIMRELRWSFLLRQFLIPGIHKLVLTLTLVKWVFFLCACVCVCECLFSFDQSFNHSVLISAQSNAWFPVFTL